MELQNRPDPEGAKGDLNKAIVPLGLVLGMLVVFINNCYAPDRREGDSKRCFCPSVCLSVRPSRI